MDATQANELRNRLAARYAPPAAGVSWEAVTTRLPFLLAPPPLLLGSGPIELLIGVTGTGPVSIQDISSYPPGAASHLAWRAKVVAVASSWVVMQIELRLRAGHELAWSTTLGERDAISLCLLSPDIVSSAQWSFELPVEPIRIVGEPNSLDFGMLAPLGLTECAIERGEQRLEGCGRELKLRGPGTAWLALNDGVYRWRSVDGEQLLVLQRYRRRLRLHNRSERELLVACGAAIAGIRILPPRWVLAPGGYGDLEVQLDPAEVALVRWAKGHPQLVLDVSATTDGDRTPVAAGDLRIPLTVQWHAPVIALRTAVTWLAPQPFLASAKQATLTVPVLIAGAGSVHVKAHLLGSDGQSADEIAAPLDLRLHAQGETLRSVEIELALQPAALLNDVRRRFRLVLETDQLARDLRQQSVELELALRGRLLATQALTIHIYAGFRYRLALAFHLLDPDSPATPCALQVVALERDGAVLDGLAIGPDGTSDDLLPNALVTQEATTAAPPGSHIVRLPALELDLSQVANDATGVRCWVQVRDETHGLRQRIALELALLPAADLLTAQTTVVEGIEMLQVRIANRTDCTWRLARLTISGLPTRGLPLLELPLACELAPNASNEQYIELPARDTTLLQRLTRSKSMIELSLEIASPAVTLRRRIALRAV